MDDFSFKLRSITEKIAFRLETLVRKVTFDIGASMVSMSPVDTGRFRSNWQYANNSINKSTVSETDKSGEVSLTRIIQGLSEWKSGESIWITNSLPYAQKLENGWSKQAPYGFVRVTLAAYKKHVDDVAKSLK